MIVLYFAIYSACYAHPSCILPHVLLSWILISYFDFFQNKTKKNNINFWFLVCSSLRHFADPNRLVARIGFVRTIYDRWTSIAVRNGHGCRWNWGRRIVGSDAIATTWQCPGSCMVRYRSIVQNVSSLQLFRIISLLIVFFLFKRKTIAWWRFFHTYYL